MKRGGEDDGWWQNEKKDTCSNVHIRRSWEVGVLLRKSFGCDRKVFFSFAFESLGSISVGLCEI